ncbi:alpha amylase C-terminal domain-containing protein [Hyalangium minutum]|uniref:1,4-alpha-glucan branching enzyme n=1 Tax=Hyalangium minutum TaxID=394096 RepID=A0A085WWH0_9BACT|nr:alpha-amylase family glycosyl hydrolase [Hyalangium minutum]KFE72033.1 1,4-alpha-glucan branching enzyme [Hyalangium minutum]
MSDTKINRPALNPAPAPAAAKGNAPTNTAKETGSAASAKKPAGSNATASTASTKASAARATDGFESTGKASRPGVAAAQSLSAVTTAAAPGQPVKKTMTLVYDAGPHSNLTDVKLKGSWDAQGRFSNQWDAGSIPMRSLGNGKWEATVELQDDGLPRNWEWGVTVDGPSGNDQWAVMGEGNLKLDLSKPSASYAPTTYHEMGSQKRGDDISFKLWAPDARAVQVKVTDQQGNVQRIPMQKAENGDWAAEVKGGWKQLEGKSYVYEVVDSGGLTSDRPDPYARQMMGEQRGIDRLYVDPMKGREENRYFPGASELTRFTIDDEENAAGAYLVLKDADGKQLNREQLLARLGAGDAGLVDKVRGGKFNDLWSQNVEADGRIKMANHDGAWTALVNNPEKLVGLRYEFQVMESDGKGGLQLRDDTNKDGAYSAAERQASGFNDPWSDLITADSGVSFRGSVVTDPTSFQWKNDSAPREKDPSKWVVYQLHVGSFLGQGGNSNRSTFEDLTKKLDHFKELGVNTLELLPTNEVEGSRNWGYLGVNSLASESSFGFEDETGKWVTGDEALKRFIDEAHGRGLNVISDVVYNHVHGDNNGLWNLGGAQNPYFNWSKEPGKFEQRDTPWGAVPAYHNPKVKQLFVDHAVQQISELKFDGLRFDFTEPIKGVGGKDGWEMLREINRQVHFVNPNTWTVAEQFDYDPAISRPAKADGTGGGFDAQWYTEFQHKLINDNSKPGLIQAASRGQTTDMDAFVNLLTAPRGLDGWKHALSIISNHDEVGNAQRTMNTAEGNKPTDFPDQWSRDAARFAAGIGFASPGIPMFFQGDEFGAQNDFRWGNTSTWDSDWSWESLGKNWDWTKVTFNDAQKASYERLFTLSPQAREQDGAYKSLSAQDKQVFNHLAGLGGEQRTEAMLDITRKQQFQFYKDAIALRNSSPAFQADAEVNRVYTHNNDSVMAFTRKSGNEEYLIVGSLNHQNLDGYNMPLPPGNWKEVLNSDAGAYGGGNFGNFGATLNGGGNTKVNIPSAGYVVFKKA